MSEKPLRSFQITVSEGVGDSEPMAVIHTAVSKTGWVTQKLMGRYTLQQIKDRIDFLMLNTQYSEMDSNPEERARELHILLCARELLAEEIHWRALMRPNPQK